MVEQNTVIANHLQAAMEAGNLAWWEMDLPSGAIRFDANKTKMLGYDAKDFTHYKHFTDIVHKDDYEKIMKAMRDHMEGKNDIYETEYRIQAKNGSWLWFYDRGRIVTRNPDASITAIGVVIDITTQMEALETLKEKTEELEALNSMFIDRELRMVELKEEIERLKQK